MDEEREARLTAWLSKRAGELHAANEYTIPDMVLITDEVVADESGVTIRNVVYFLCDTEPEVEDALIWGVGLQYGFIKDAIDRPPMQGDNHA